MIETTTRVHMNPREALGSLEHVRSKEFRCKESHVDSRDGRFEVWKDTSVYDTYKDVFGDAIQEYNSRQKRKDRKILDENGDEVGGYIQSIQEGRRGKRERVIYKKNEDGSKEAVGKRQESQGQRLLYELVVSAGNCEKLRDERGRVMYTDDGHEIHPHRVPYEVNKAAVRSFFNQFETFYPHFRLSTVAWHGDEYYINAKGVKESGIEHAHACFIPWADGYTRGLSRQASMSKALQQMGYVNGEDESGVWHNAYFYFTQDAQRRFETILQKEYERYMLQHPDEYRQRRDFYTVKDFEGTDDNDPWAAFLKENGSVDLAYCMGYAEPLTFVHPAKGKNLPNLDPSTYRELKDIERKVIAARVELDKIQKEIADKKTELSDAESKMAEAENVRKNADTYYDSRKKESDELVRVTKERCEKRMAELDLKFGDLDSQYKSILDDLEMYRKKCDEVLAQDVSIDIPIPALSTWLKKNKISRGGKWVTLYDACVKDLEPIARGRVQKKKKDAEEMDTTVRRQRELAARLLLNDEEDECDAEYEK